MARSHNPQLIFLADLVGCCEGGPADLSSNPAYLSDFGIN
jgi:hypothetical protein